MKNKHTISLIAGVVILAFFIIAALFPNVFTDYGLKYMDTAWLAPSGEHLLGTNDMGYDIFTEIIYGRYDTLFIGIASSILTLILGTSIGVLSTHHNALGNLFNSIINLFVLLPKLITLIVLSSMIGSSRQNLIVLIAAFSWSGIARNIRARVIHINSQPFIENCIIQGFSRLHIVVRHVLPNIYDVLISRFLLGINSCIMMESTLSFLGFGDLYHPTWGTMINFAYRRGAFLRQAFNYLLSPGICIILLSLSFYLISIFFEKKRETIHG